MAFLPQGAYASCSVCVAQADAVFCFVLFVVAQVLKGALQDSGLSDGDLQCALDNTKKRFDAYFAPAVCIYIPVMKFAHNH